MILAINTYFLYIFLFYHVKNSDLIFRFEENFTNVCYVSYASYSISLVPEIQYISIYLADDYYT